MFGDLNWPLSASLWFISISWASCFIDRYVRRAILPAFCLSVLSHFHSRCFSCSNTQSIANAPTCTCGIIAWIRHCADGGNRKKNSERTAASIFSESVKITVLNNRQLCVLTLKVHVYQVHSCNLFLRRGRCYSFEHQETWGISLTVPEI